MTDMASPGKQANMPKKRTPSVANSAKTIERKPSEAPGSVVSHAQSKVSAAGTQPVEEEDEEEFEEVDDDEEEEDDGTEEAFPAGTVDHKGDIVDDEGKVIGHALGDNISELEGSVVDQEGDILDKEGNVVGSADLIEGVSKVSKAASGVDGSKVSKAASGVESAIHKPMQDIDPTPEDSASQVGGPIAEKKSQARSTINVAESQIGSAVSGAKSEVGDAEKKTELVAPFGVQDNGEITNATGGVIGQLTEGSPQELVGTSIKEIDQDGNLKLESGSVVGQGEIPELLEHDALTEDAVSQLDKDTPAETVDEESKIDAAKSVVGSQAPTEKAGSKLDSAVDKSVVDSQAPKENVGSQIGSKVDAKSAVGSQVGDAKSAVGTEAPGEEDIKEPEILGSQVSSKVDAKSAVGSQVGDAKSAVGTEVPGEENVPEPEALSSQVGSKVDATSAVGSKAPGEEGTEVATSQLGDKVEEGKSAVGSQVGSKLDAKSVAPGEDIETSQLGDKVEEGKSVVGSQVPQGDEAEVGSQVSEKAGSLVGSQIPADKTEVRSQVGSKLDAESVAPGEDIEGAEVPTSQLGDKVGEAKSVVGSKVGSTVDAKSVAPGGEIEGAEPSQLGSQVSEKLGSDGKPIAREIDDEGNPIDPTPTEGEAPKLDAEGQPIEVPEEAEKIDLSILKGKKVNKLGKLVDASGTPYGQLAEGDLKKLIGRKADADGIIWDDSGKQIGRAELLPEDEREAEPSAPFEDFPDSILDAKGNVIYQGQIVGKLIEGDAKKLEGKKVDADGDVLDKNGNLLGRAERYQEEEAVPEPEEAEAVVDLSLLEGKKVNKAGNVVDDQGRLFGQVTSGILAKLINKKVDRDGKIWGEAGKVIGTAELIPAEDRDEKAISEFEDFPGAVVDRHGNVIFDGQIVGKLIEGDARKLVGKKIDQDGEIVDRLGNVLGRAERYVEEDAAPEPEPEKIDMSALAGKRVNKAGKIVDGHGDIYGILVEGDAKKLAGRMCDKNGHVFDEGGNIVGRAELVPESERAGQKEGPFAGFASPTVTKDGMVADVKGTIIGRLIAGDAKMLYGKEVDQDGDVLDNNGNSVGRAERYEVEEKPQLISKFEGRKVNKEGNVVNSDGDLIAKLTEGDAIKCAGKEIDADGDVYNSKNQVIGHVTLIEEIPEPVVEPEPEPEPVVEPEPVAEPEPEPEVEESEDEETEEEKAERLEREQDRKLAGQMAQCIQASIDNIRPVLTMITEAIDAAERQPKDQLDEQKLVDTVKPLIEQGHAILMEANGVIRGLDPDGHIAAQSKGRAGSKDASPEEYRLADLLKELTGNVHTTIENAKKKIAGMPHAKKELNPLWGLLAEPLGQILAAVGLLLAGVLGLVGRLLSGLGLGGLLDNLLGGLGLKGILKGLGLGMVTESLTGKKN